VRKVLRITLSVPLRPSSPSSALSLSPSSSLSTAARDLTAPFLRVKTLAKSSGQLAAAVVVLADQGGAVAADGRGSLRCGGGRGHGGGVVLGCAERIRPHADKQLPPLVRARHLPLIHSAVEGERCQPQIRFKWLIGSDEDRCLVPPAVVLDLME
jgi:hypothetical protein